MAAAGRLTRPPIVAATMAVTSGDFQSTPLSPRAESAGGGGRAAGAATDVAPEPVGGAGEPSVAPDPSRIGVVFVHGIGTQRPAETFLDWSAPLVQLLSAWRLEHGHGVDPVRRAEFSFSGTSSPYLELDVPAEAGHPAQTWLMTEAWWAAQVRAPSLGMMTAYLRRGLPRMMAGIKAGYGPREKAWSARRERSRGTAAAASPAAGRAGTAAPPAVDERTAAPSGSAKPDQSALAAAELASHRGWVWIDALDRIQKELTILSAGPALVVGTLVLLLYAPFRALSLGALRDAAVLRSADSKLTDWFGDLPDLLDDPVQAANVRARLAAAIASLQALGCGRIVVVAHSGGAIVSWTTLLDAEFAGLPVASLVTIGEGLALAWRLEDASAGLPPGSRLTGSLAAARPELNWFDYWATYDPAAGGYLSSPPGASLSVESRPITNRMSILDDHGSYWDNDEGFLIPLLRHLDTAGGPPEGSRFYRDDALRAVRIERRRQRVAVLALWRWVAGLGAVVPLGVTSVLALLGLGAGPARLGAAVTGWWGSSPFGGLVGAPLDWLASWASWPAALRPVGEWAVGTVLVAVVFLLIGGAGASIWDGWDSQERLAARAARLAPLDRRRPLLALLASGIATALLSVLVGVWLAGA
ncbi:MAG: hypothetical protein ACXWMU_04735 [Candidatus Limnocylindrales bacterium]